MIHLITSGSGSGKSAYAEEWLMCHKGNDSKFPCLYIATMMPYGSETKKKIERHHRLRAGKGFQTLERYTDLAGLGIPENQGILLECMSNLAANEFYHEDGSMEEVGSTCERILKGVSYLVCKTPCLVIVTNEVNSDINSYSSETEQYRNLIGRLNQELGQMADRVTEVVYGIPVVIKE